jgi:drug/metabolite transporter (DMT)-like permease
VKTETKGAILAILTAIISGIAIPINKLFIVNLDPTVFTAVRAIVIGTIFLIVVSFQSGFDYKKFKHVPWKYLIAIGVVGGALAFLLYFTGLQLTEASAAAFLKDGMLPIFTTILAFVFLKERISRNMVYAMVVMLVGIVMIYLSQVNPSQLWSNPQLGDILIIISVVLWAIEYVIAKKAMSLGETNFVVSFARMFFGGIILLGFVLLFGKLGTLLALSMQQWINILISTALLFGYVLFWYWSIRMINVSKASALFLISPVIALIASIIIFGEQPQAIQLVGSAAVLVGAYILIGVKSGHRKE